MTLLDRYFVQPVTQLGNTVIHEVTDVVHPLVHAVEQPISNVVNDSKEIVGGLYHASRAVVNLAPYWVGGWLIWTAFETYFPEEYGSVRSSLDRASKRMRLY